MAQLGAADTRFWLQLGLAALVIGTVLIVLWRMSRVVLTLVALGIVAYVAYTWCYERSEPAFMSPVVDRIVPYLPEIGGAAARQPAAAPLPLRDNPPPPEALAPVPAVSFPQQQPPPPARRRD
ncbi:MAG: hypothetical protein LBR12_01730 [Opitutaceae bacterium]|jgi:hypothetical protein|nr:hypothetical protein [Opitutaceae bacterium]